MQEAFLKLISGDFTTNLAFGIIVAISFLLGMLVWALLAHFPASRQLKKLNKELEGENTVLKKDNKDLSERYTVVQAKFNRTNEDLQTAEANLKEKNEKVNQQLKKIKFLSEELELYKDNARNFKEANEKLLEEHKRMAKEHEEMQLKVEDIKGLIEEVEQEKGEMLKGHLEVSDAKLIADKALKTTTDELEKAAERIELLKKDLDAALEQKAELKKMLLTLEATQELDGTNDDDLKIQLVGLKAHIQDLEAENSDLMERLAPYLAKEHSDEQEEKEMDELLVNLLVEAEENMKEDGFYVDYDESQLIEDKIYLEKTLAEEAKTELPTAEEEEEVTLEGEEEEAMNHALTAADTAMGMQGFYEDMDEAILRQPATEIEQVSDDDLMEQHLAHTAEVMDKVLFFSEEVPRDSLIENETLLDNELPKFVFAEQPSDESEEQLVLTHTDHEDMNNALDQATMAMDAEGLYAPIDTQKLIASEEDSIGEKTENQKHSESTILQEIGRSIPKALSNQKDDLQQIDGIGLFIEQRLNELGIYTYEQISQFDTTFIAKLGAVLGFSEQTIARDKWVEQAQALLDQ
ncbi:hypothetical protein [Aureispira anguillae]|uniref:Uncharacterized protein n=1 Tax=Aureispira anguillae TaxID=2864201 RepID=A0A915Y9G0_9BACT|nr:hypothetical protein [Aureispira anguillae]BDS09443.1 hypothetical protein AsAng_0001410 [Aureispira anguillae]